MLPINQRELSWVTNTFKITQLSMENHVTRVIEVCLVLFSELK